MLYFLHLIVATISFSQTTLNSTGWVVTHPVVASFSISSSVSLSTSEVGDSHSMDSKSSSSIVASAVSHKFVLNLAVAEYKKNKMN